MTAPPSTPLSGAATCTGERALDLIGLGECMVELLSAQPLGEAPTLTRSYGGDVLNSLIGAARAGSRCGFVTRVGNDPFGPGLLAAWKGEGLDLSCAPLVDGENGVYFISLLPGGEREFTYRRAGSAASGLSPADVRPEYVASAGTVLLSGITQAISASAQAATLRAAQLAQAAGTRVAFDPNFRPRLWAARGGVAAASAALREVMPYVDVLLPSFPADAELLGAEGAALAAQGPEALAAAFGALRPGALVALKAGEDGVYLSGIGRVPAEVVRNVLDTTGAGDAWNGAFLHALGRGVGQAEAAAQACRAAAYAIGHRGAIPPRGSPQEGFHD